MCCIVWSMRRWQWSHSCLDVLILLFFINWTRVMTVVSRELFVDCRRVMWVQRLAPISHLASTLWPASGGRSTAAVHIWSTPRPQRLYDSTRRRATAERRRRRRRRLSEAADRLRRRRRRHRCAAAAGGAVCRQTRYGSVCPQCHTVVYSHCTRTLHTSGNGSVGN